jgi:hypothetical protein
MELDLGVPGRGEAPCRDAQEVEAVTATAEPESHYGAHRASTVNCSSSALRSPQSSVAKYMVKRDGPRTEAVADLPEQPCAGYRCHVGISGRAKVHGPQGASPNRGRTR